MLSTSSAYIKNILYKEFTKMFDKKKFHAYKYITIPFSICPVATFIYIVISIVNAVLPAVLVIVMADFIDKAVQIIQKSDSIRNSYESIIALLICVLISHICKIVGEYAKSRLKLKLSKTMRQKIVEKKTFFPIPIMENEEQCNLIERVSSGCEQRFFSGFVNWLQLVEYIVRGGCFIVIVASVMPLIAVILTVLSLALLQIALKCGKEDYEAFEQTAGLRRYARALREVLSSREYVEERTLFEYSNRIEQRWFEKTKSADDAELVAVRRNMIHTKTANIITVGISTIIAIVLIIPMKLGSITIGLYLSLIKQVMNLVEILTWQLNPLVEEFQTNRQYMQDYEKFLELQADLDIDDVEIEHVNLSVDEIRFEHVSFKYPGTEKYVLKDFSFTFCDGKSYALVGVNGAGKTTLVKLLLGFYDDYEGIILLNGMDIRQMKKTHLREYFSVVYQDYARFPVTIREFLQMGIYAKKVREDDKLLQVLKSLKMSEVLEKLPLGLDTPLGKLYEKGTELSGGEWQKLAIARCMLRTAPVRILDEPTAAIDPVSEAELYETFEVMSKNFLAVIITHRLALAKKADEIIVLSDGRVMEHGNHVVLMAQNEIYAEMFEMQRRWYQNETKTILEID